MVKIFALAKYVLGVVEKMYLRVGECFYCKDVLFVCVLLRAVEMIDLTLGYCCPLYSRKAILKLMTDITIMVIEGIQPRKRCRPHISRANGPNIGTLRDTRHGVSSR